MAALQQPAWAARLGRPTPEVPVLRRSQPLPNWRQQRRYRDPATAGVVNTLIRSVDPEGRVRRAGYVSGEFGADGTVFDLIGQPGALALGKHGVPRLRFVVSTDVESPMTRLIGFPGPGQETIWRENSVTIQDIDGGNRTSRDAMRQSFRNRTGFGHHFDDFQLGYFFGYALWNYVNTPFMFAHPALQVRRVTSNRHDVMLKVTFPRGFHTHSRVQRFAFDRDAQTGRLLLNKLYYDFSIFRKGLTPVVHRVRNYTQSPEGVYYAHDRVADLRAKAAEKLWAKTVPRVRRSARHHARRVASLAGPFAFFAEPAIRAADDFVAVGAELARPWVDAAARHVQRQLPKGFAITGYVDHVQLHKEDPSPTPAP
jgi:hypothetical protein